LKQGNDIRPTIAVTKAHMRLMEIEKSVKEGRLQVDGKIVLNDVGELAVTKGIYPPLSLINKSPWNQYGISLV
jgi:hypothetical protein